MLLSGWKELIGADVTHCGYEQGKLCPQRFYTGIFKMHSKWSMVVRGYNPSPGDTKAVGRFTSSIQGQSGPQNRILSQ